MRHIPNILSSIRIVMTGVFCWLFFRAVKHEDFSFWWPILIYAVAFLTDVLDGFLARRFHWITALGKILDPLADKLMACAALVCILSGKVAQNDNIVFYTVIFLLILVKDILLIIGGLYMLRSHRVAYADWYGKSATGVLAAGIVLTLLSFALPSIEPWNIAVLSAAVALSFISLVHYAVTQMFSKPVKSAEDPDESKLFETVDHISNNMKNNEQGIEQLFK